MAPASTPEGPDPDLLDRLRAFQAEVRQLGRANEGVGVKAGTPAAALSPHEAAVIERLVSLSADLAVSLEQSIADVSDVGRRTFMAPAGEAREVMRAVIHRLAPDSQVRKQPWYKGHDGRPTQAERVRYAARQRGHAAAESAVEASDLVEERIGRLGRSIYERASKALHAGTQRLEAQKIINAVLLVLDDVLPD